MLKYICSFLAPALNALDPPSLNDTNNDPCLVLAEVDHYTFDANSGGWLPHPRNGCWFIGIVINMRVYLALLYVLY